MARLRVVLVFLVAAGGCQKQDPEVQASIAFLAQESSRQDAKLIELQLANERLQKDLEDLQARPTPTAAAPRPEPAWIMWRRLTALPGRLGYRPGPPEALDAVETKDRCLSRALEIASEHGGEGQTYFTAENTVTLTCLPQGVTTQN